MVSFNEECSIDNKFLQVFIDKFEIGWIFTVYVKYFRKTVIEKCDMAKRENDYFSKTIENGFSIINLFDQTHTRRNLTEISKILSINTTSTYRYVNTLIELGYLNTTAKLRLLVFERVGPFSFDVICKPLDFAVNGIQRFPSFPLS